MEMWRKLGSRMVGHKIRRNIMELQIQFDRHYELLKIEYPNITKESLLKGLDIYAAIRPKE